MTSKLELTIVTPADKSFFSFLRCSHHSQYRSGRDHRPTSLQSVHQNHRSSPHRTARWFHLSYHGQGGDQDRERWQDQGEVSTYQPGPDHGGESHSQRKYHIPSATQLTKQNVYHCINIYLTFLVIVAIYSHPKYMYMWLKFQNRAGNLMVKFSSVGQITDFCGPNKTQKWKVFTFIFSTVWYIHSCIFL